MTAVDGEDGRSRKSVLLVEDDDDIRECLSELLADAGYGVVTAPNGAVALAYLQKCEHPCLILLDLIMPVMNGSELLSALRSDDVLAPLPVVVVSATPEEALNVRPLTQGFVKKPVDFELLLELVGRYCGAHA